MVCSEKELGISDEHEGIIILDDDAPVGMPLVDYMGDAVFDIAITPNMARNANMLGVAREGGRPHRDSAAPSLQFASRSRRSADRGQGERLRSREPELNPRFVLGLIRGCQDRAPALTGCSAACAWRACARSTTSWTPPTTSCWKSASRCTPSITMCWCSAPADKAPTIITRTAKTGEKLTTLDDVERKLDDFTVLVCDTAGALSLAGVMGGPKAR